MSAGKEFGFGKSSFWKGVCACVHTLRESGTGIEMLPEARTVYVLQLVMLIMTPNDHATQHLAWIPVMVLHTKGHALAC